MKIQIIDPSQYEEWNDLVSSTHNYSFFHTSNWSEVLSESYDYHPLYFSVINNSKLLALVPVMEVKSFLTGKRGVSLPFSDYCEPIISEKIDFKNILDCLIEYGKNTGWKYLEIRDGKNFSLNIKPSSYYFRHVLDLSQDETVIFSNFRDSTKRNIKKAIKEGVMISISNSLQAISEFYQLNCLTRRDHGLPPQPYYFFKKIYEHIISKNLGLVVLASYKLKFIAGAIYFHFKDKALFKYGASDKRYQNLRTNNLVMWEAIKWYSRNGFKSLCFGRTEPENKGLMQYKEGWGAEEYIIEYYKYDLEKDTFVQNNYYLNSFPKKVFRIMPLPLLRLIGSTFYKHIA